MALLLTIALWTPWWAPILFTVLLALGMRAQRGRRMVLWRTFIVAGIFTVWGVTGLLQHITFAPLAVLAAWMAGGAVGVAVLILTFRPAFRIEKAGVVLMRGSVVPLLRYMTVFFAKYGVQVAMGLWPERWHDLAILDVAVSGFGTGHFAAWSIAFLSTYRRVQRKQQAQPKEEHDGND